MVNQKRLRQQALWAGLLILIITGVAHPRQPVWTGVDRIVAVGDVHGDYEQFVKTLRAAEVIDEQNKWIGGKTHLVQTGDVLDRGPDSRQAMDLLINLEVQALKAGGRVHALIGNHEAMVLHRDLRYVHSGEYASYGGKASYLKALGADGKYGKWIARHNAIIKINDVLFVHGGIGPRYATMALEEINETIRHELKQPGDPNKSMSRSSEGPLWYRGLAREAEDEIEELLKTVFKTHGVKRIVFGHSVSKGGIRMRSGGRLIMIDVGMSKIYGGPAGCLTIENDKYYAVYPESRQELVVGKEVVKTKE